MSREIVLANLVDPNQLVELKQMDDFLAVINMDPPEKLIRSHPMAKGVQYLPIDKVEMMLTKVFQQWHVEILREGQLLNSVYVTVRLHFKHPILKEWTFQDGTGAAPIQTDAGKSAADLAAIKNDAIMKALPAAESYAVKDAAEKIGKVFGRDMNRKDTLAFTPSYSDGEVQRNAVSNSINNSVAKAKQHASNQDQPSGGAGVVASTATGPDHRQEVETR